MSEEQKEYPFAVFGTQGGGLVQEVVPGVYQFVEAPDPGTGLNVGDFKPDMWSVMPANNAASRQVSDEEFDDDAAMEDVMDMLHDGIRSRIP